MTALKNSVKLSSLKPQIVVAFVIASDIARSLGLDLIVTSANDSKHMTGSKHFVGEALDFRTHDWDDLTKSQFVAKLRACLTSDFDVVFEAANQPNEHLHVEWDPK